MKSKQRLEAASQRQTGKGKSGVTTNSCAFGQNSLQPFVKDVNSESILGVNGTVSSGGRLKKHGGTEKTQTAAQSLPSPKYPAPSQGKCSFHSANQLRSSKFNIITNHAEKYLFS